MPEYSLDQKAKVFDHLWKECGQRRPELFDFVSRSVGVATEARVPRYKFEIIAEGDFRSFAEVLHYLATK